MVFETLEPEEFDVKIAQEQLGHASISTTINIYTHVIDALHRKAIEAVENSAADRFLPGLRDRT